DLNDAQRLRVDPAMRTVVGGRAKDHAAASTSEIGRFETETLTTRENLNRLMDLAGQWIERAHQNRKLRGYPGRARFVATSRYPNSSCTGSMDDRRNSFDINAFRPMSRGFPDSLSPGSSSTWTARSARLTAGSRAPPSTATSAAPATIPCSCSTS